MLEQLGTSQTAVAAVALVVALGLWRTYLGTELLSLRFLSFWGTTRRLYMPVVDRVAKRVVGVGAENNAVPDEHVGDFDATPSELAARIDAASEHRFEVSVFSGLKTDWGRNTEVASIVAYVGPKPWPGAPFWLRAEQIHVFMFRVGDQTRTCAHLEANAYRPDKWKDHLQKGPSFDAEAGVQAVETWVQEATA